MSLRKSARYTGASNKRLYAIKKPRIIKIDKKMADLVQQIGRDRPTYGTRRMAVTQSRITTKPVNRKKMQKIYRFIGWIIPTKSKKEIVRSRKRPTPTRPNQLWQADMTYIWCDQDRWCYLFNVLDAFTREWVGYAFETRAVTDGAIAALTKALASKKPDCSKLVIRTDNGSQYISTQFDKTVKAYGVRQEFIHYHTHTRAKRSC